MLILSIVSGCFDTDLPPFVLLMFGLLGLFKRFCEEKEDLLYLGHAYA